MLAVTAGGAIAQDNSNIRGEVRVSAVRGSGDGYFKESAPVIGLRRLADGAIQDILVTSDSRDSELRRQEIHAMLEATIRKADAAGLELVTGNFELTKVTLANYRELPLRSGRRSDTSEIAVTVKTKLAGPADSAQSRIDSFIRSVPATGRSLIEKYGALQLTIVNPDQYRGQIIKLIADESRRASSAFGADYGVVVSGLDRHLVWNQASENEVFLYIPYGFTVQPKGA
ncbi:TonB-dependent receptor [Sphingopyxis sp. PET50]|uniref:TonB-dependent receptor n=1 Tax=Sphingopyxis sp. PET50 TaxID=2976533 RepID=UPI0021AF631D|nr:TonB-dependent receptor [Sphingopyxis sp. PET50]